MNLVAVGIKKKLIRLEDDGKYFEPTTFSVSESQRFSFYPHAPPP